jgi:thiol-disulfide isomerase/thioredoxin
MNMLCLRRIGFRLLLAGLLLAPASFLTAASVKVGDAFPDLAKFKLEDKVPGDLKGKVVLIDFWASWCAPCKKSFPALNRLQQRYGDKGLVIIAVNVDEQRAKMERFLKDIPASFAVSRDAQQQLVAAVEVETMPTSFLLDASGRVRFTHVGYLGDETEKQYVHEIEELLKAR